MKMEPNYIKAFVSGLEVFIHTLACLVSGFGISKALEVVGVSFPMPEAAIMVAILFVGDSICRLDFIKLWKS